MKKKVLLISTIAILLTSCESKLDKLIKEGSREVEAYIEAFNNAQSEDEVRAIERDLRNWDNNYWEKEMEKIEHEISITEKQKIMQDEYYNSLKEGLKEAKRNAYKRFE